MHDVAVAETDCRIQFRFLPDDCRPAYVVRHNGVTLIAIDPRSSRSEIFDWTPVNLLVEERNFLRRAYGQPPVGEAMPIAEPADLPLPTHIPRAVRMPGGLQWDYDLLDILNAS